MDINFKQQFLEKWNKYFPGADLPIIFFYTDDGNRAEPVPPDKRQSCLICDLGAVRKGKSLCFDASTISCWGGKRYLGFTQTTRRNFEYFLSYGIKGELEGERYKKTPELVKEQQQEMKSFVAPSSYIVFRRFDQLEPDDTPMASIFFATPDVLSGLFTLANFDQAASPGVIAPFGAGCGSIVYYPYFEGQSENPRAVLGMFDVSARKCVPAGVLTFAIPWSKFVTMVNNMDESFLITETWGHVRKRIAHVATA